MQAPTDLVSRGLTGTGGAAPGDDAPVRVRREVRWLLWALWLCCLVFDLWAFRVLYLLYTSDT